MIIREWRGRAAPDNAHAYPEHFRTTVLPELERIPGFLGAALSRRRLGERIEFLVLTRWQSLDAIRAFAGDDLTTAVVEPGAVASLVEFDREARHYDLIAELSRPSG